MRKKRFLFVDLLRFVAIFLMFWDHGLKLFYNFATRTCWQEFFTRLFTELLVVTSLSSALFLFLVGFSLVISFQKHKDKKRKTWIKKKTKRGIILILLSYLLFFFKYGLTRKEALATSGILQLIGLFLIFGSWLFMISRKVRVILAILLNYLGLIIDFALRAKEIQIPLLNVYIFPFLPHGLYGLTGLLVAEGFFYWQEKETRKKYLKKLLWGSLIGLVVFVSAAELNPLLPFKLRHLTGGFWQPSIILVLYNSLIITAALALLAIFEEKLRKSLFLQKIGLFGQEALGIYFFQILLGYGVSQYLLKEARFAFWAPLLAVAVFCLLGWTIIKLQVKKTTFRSLGGIPRQEQCPTCS